MDKELKDLSEQMGKRVDGLRRDLRTVRTGRASTALLDHVRIDYYGQPTPLNQVATLAAPEANLLVIQPWDPGSLPAIEKSIRISDLGLTPSNDGRVIRLPVPPLTEERRTDLVKRVRGLAEEARVAIRNLRREANDRLKKREKGGELPEDAVRRLLEETQSLTDRHIKEIDELLDQKAREIMEG